MLASVTRQNKWMTAAYQNDSCPSRPKIFSDDGIDSRRWIAGIRKTWVLLMICAVKVMRVAMIRQKVMREAIPRCSTTFDKIPRERKQTPKGKRALNSCLGKRAQTRGVDRSPREIFRIPRTGQDMFVRAFWDALSVFRSFAFVVCCSCVCSVEWFAV